MKWLDNYIDKWISKKAIEVLRHKIVMCGYKTITIVGKDFFELRIQKLKEKKPATIAIINFKDGLEFYHTWSNLSYESVMERCRDVLDEQSHKTVNFDR